MPTWEVTEYRTYTVTFTVTAETREAAIAAAEALPLDAGDEVEGGCDEVQARRIDAPSDVTHNERPAQTGLPTDPPWRQACLMGG